jgi:hypothetical protein
MQTGRRNNLPFFKKENYDKNRRFGKRITTQMWRLGRKCYDSGFGNRDIPEEREEAHSGLTSTEEGRERNESIFTVLSVEAWIPQQVTVQDSASYSNYA